MENWDLECLSKTVSGVAESVRGMSFVGRDIQLVGESCSGGVVVIPGFGR